MTVTLWILAGLVLGFSFAGGAANTKGSIKLALFAGVVAGAFLGVPLLISGAGWIIAGCFFCSSIAGSIIAAVTPNDNCFKQYFNLAMRKRYKVHVKSGSAYDSWGGELVEIDAEAGSTVFAYENAVVNAASGSTIFKHKGAVVRAEQGANVIDCT